MAEVTITEASRVLGVSPDTIRRRIARGELQARKTSSSHGEIYMVELPDKATPAPSEITGGDASATGPAPGTRTVGSPATAPVQDLENEALKKTISILEEELAARRREIQELHILLQKAQTTALPAGRRQGPQAPWWRRLFGLK